MRSAQAAHCTHTHPHTVRTVVHFKKARMRCTTSEESVFMRRWVPEWMVKGSLQNVRGMKSSLVHYSIVEPLL